MPEIQKHLSKGMRRHIRRQKAEDGKKQSIKETCQIKQIARERVRKEQQEKERIANLPDFQGFPRAEKETNLFSETKYLCPKCFSDEEYRWTTDIETRQGIKKIHECTRCYTKYRIN